MKIVREHRARVQHELLVEMGIDTVPWDDKPESYRKQLIKAEENRTRKHDIEMGLIKPDDKKEKKKKKKK